MYSLVYLWKLFIFLFLLSISHIGIADIVIIANLNSKIETITKEQAKNLWLGKSKKLPGTGRIKILEHKKESQLKLTFHEIITQKNQIQLNAYWAKIIFTGMATPPKSIRTDSEIIEIVSHKTNTLGYIDSKSINKNIKVLMFIK